MSENQQPKKNQTKQKTTKTKKKSEQQDLDYGLEQWEKSRLEWTQNSTKHQFPTKKLYIFDPVMSYRKSKFNVKFATPVRLTEMVHLLVEVWDGENMID
ncbi:hypothetical protein M0813_07970 [Anaeramoeba flamelloides]|uniref:DUF4050 domain-containing protein n=1 Tax=Anaeramoeba flamelloides TaxID=1746091 RepID=A0ABQ8XA56_9EUKA|nr:hypothetical protein M0813_07970 [Anaeramoeba flamelloides]